MKITAILSLFMLLIAGGCSARDEGEGEGTQYGKTLVAEFKVPPETLVKFEEFKPSERKPGESALEAAMLADTETWEGPSIEADSTANPYKIVVTLSARVKEDGDAVSMWRVGWNLGREEGTRLTLMPGLTRSNLKAGQNFTATAASDPLSFKKDRSAGLVLELVKASNIEINGVDVAVWSGIGGTSFLQKFGVFTYLITGVVMFGLWWLWFRRPKTDADL
jgi:hypothetical protein